MINELGKFEEVQGCVIVLSLAPKVEQSQLSETVCPFNGHTKLCTICLLYHVYNQQKMQ